MAELVMKWYVLRAVSGKEYKAKELIDADIKNGVYQDFVSQILIPTEKYVSVVNGKKVVKERSTLPGYVLIECALVGEVSHGLTNTNNVIGFLGGKNPVPLRKSEVDRMLGATTTHDDVVMEDSVEIPYMVGETVKVADGPFSGFSGIVQEVNPEKKKLKVMVKIFERKTPLELDFMQVEKE